MDHYLIQFNHTRYLTFVILHFGNLEFVHIDVTKHTLNVSFSNYDVYINIMRSQAK